MPVDKIMFVICPIGAEGSPARTASDKLMKFVINPVAVELHYVVERADTIMETGTITSHIFNRLVAAPLVVADMTGHNPNVFYELAVRHAVRKPVIHLISTGETIPFDVAPQRALFYELELDAVEVAKDTLRKMIKAIEDAGDDEQESPISDALGRVQLQRSPQSSAKRESEMLAMLSDIRARLVNIESTAQFRLPDSTPASGSEIVSIARSLAKLASKGRSWEPDKADRQLMMTMDDFQAFLLTVQSATHSSSPLAQLQALETALLVIQNARSDFAARSPLPLPKDH